MSILYQEFVLSNGIKVDGGQSWVACSEQCKKAQMDFVTGRKVLYAEGTSYATCTSCHSYCHITGPYCSHNKSPGHYYCTHGTGYSSSYHT